MTNKEKETTKKPEVPNVTARKFSPDVPHEADNLAPGNQGDLFKEEPSKELEQANMPEPHESEKPEIDPEEKETLNINLIDKVRELEENNAWLIQELEALKAASENRDKEQGNPETQEPEPTIKPKDSIYAHLVNVQSELKGMRHIYDKGGSYSQKMAYQDLSSKITELIVLAQKL